MLITLVVTGGMGGANPCTGYSATKKIDMGLLLEVILVDVKDPKLTCSLFEKKLLLTCERFAPA